MSCRNQRYRHIYTIIALMIMTAICAGGNAEAAKKMSYDQILEKSAKINPGLETFKSDLNIKFFCLGMSMPMKGHLYFKRPDKLRMVIPVVPSILKNRRGMFQEMVPKSFNAKDYAGKILGEDKIEDKVNCILLELIPRKTGKITKVKLWVDKESMLIPKSQVFYADKSYITSLQSYRMVKGYALPDKQKVDFIFPKFSATGIIEYQTYEVNIPVDEYLNKPADNK